MDCVHELFKYLNSIVRHVTLGPALVPLGVMTYVACVVATVTPIGLEEIELAIFSPGDAPAVEAKSVVLI